MNLPKYLAYLRVSNKEHDTSLPAQMRRLKAYAQERGFELVQIYSEEKSAYKGSQRKVFNEMIEHLKHPDIKGVIFHKVDRTSRNARDFATIESFFDSRDIRVVEGEFDTSTSTGRLGFRIFCGFAMYYSENLSDEVCLKMKERLLAGYYPSKPLMGYRSGTSKDIDPKKKYPNEMAKLVKSIFSKYASGGYTYATLAAEFRRKGVHLYKHHIEKMLNNPFYCGTIRWKHRKSKEVSFYPGNHEPLVSHKLFDKVQGIKSERVVNKGKVGRNPYSKFMKCQCGKTLYWEKPGQKCKQQMYCYLRCHNKECSFTTIREDRLELEITKVLRELYLRVRHHKALAAELKLQGCTLEKENQLALKKLRAEVKCNEKRLERLKDGFIDGVLDKKTFKTRSVKIKETLKNLKENLSQTKSKIGSKSLTLTQLGTAFKKLAKGYRDADNITKRQILDFCFSNGEIINGNAFLMPSASLSGLASVPCFFPGWDQKSITKKSLAMVLKQLKEDCFTERVVRFLV